MNRPKWMRSSNDEKKLKKERERYQAQIPEYGEGHAGAPIEILMRLDRNTLNQLPAETLEKLPLERLRHLSVEALARLSPEILSGLPPEDICRLPAEKLATIPPSALAKLPPGYLQRLQASQLGLVLPELHPDVLLAISPTAIAKVDAQHLLNIPQPDLAILFNRYPDLVLKFQTLPHEQLLRLPQFVLSRLPPETFWSIPADVWEDQPDEVAMNLPPDVRKILSGRQANSSGQNEQQPTVAPVERQYRPSSPAAPPFPVHISQDGNLVSRTRAGPPLSSQNTGMALKRNNSQSTPRSRTSSPSQTFRTQALLYMEGSPPSPPERKDSRGMRDGADGFREDLPNHRPVPQGPDGMYRKDVADPWKDDMIEKLTKDVSAKDRAIEDLTGQIRDKERWNQRMDDERDNLSAQVIELKVAKQSTADRMFSSLARIDPTLLRDRPQPDLADMTTEILNYLEVLHKNANENFNISTELRQQLQSQVDELNAKDREYRIANDELTTLRYTIVQYEKQLLAADANQATWKMTENALLRERDGLVNQVNDLKQRVENEKETARINVANQHAYHETQTKGIKQQISDLQRELNEQKTKYGREIQKQHEYYEGVRKTKEAQMETLKQEHKEALQQVKKKCEDDINSQKVSFDEHLQKSRSHYEELLRNNAVHLQEKIKSLQSDLVDNSDDFRPATDDSLKTSYGKLKLMVETITETFNLGVVTIPQDGRLDPDNFLGREGKGQTRVLLRSIVWTKIIDGFFSSPFGFGSFGSGGGKTLLVELYLAWRKLFDDGSLLRKSCMLPTRRRTDR